MDLEIKEWREEHHLEVGDKIRFKCYIAFRREYGFCIVRGFDQFGEALVHFNGCKNFVVHCEEITRIVKST